MCVAVLQILPVHSDVDEKNLIHPSRDLRGSQLTAEEVNALLQQAEAVQRQALDRARLELNEARQYIEDEDYPAAGALLDRILDDLPRNAQTEGLITEVGRVRSEMLLAAARGAMNDGRMKQAKSFISRMQTGAGSRSEYRLGTREEMIGEVEQSWERPQVIDKTGREETPIAAGDPILKKLENIVIPRVTFNGELSRVLETLSELSVQYDTSDSGVRGRGVNIVLINPAGADPRVKISLRKLSLARILEYVTRQVNFQFDVDQGAVIVSRGDAGMGNTSLVTEFFPISRATVIRLTGVRNDADSGQSPPADPFAAGTTYDEPQAPPVNREEQSLKSFFARAGVPFDNVGGGPPGSSLAFDGTQLIVTQTTRNLERLRNILRRYDQTKQVEIEAKFLEVQQSDLEELGFQWSLSSGGRPVYDADGNPVLDATGRPVLQYDTQWQTANRNANSAFSIDPDEASINISSPEAGSNRFSATPPTIPNSIDLGADVVEALFGRTAVVNDDQVEMMIRALARKTGSDLLSSPRLTVLSGKTASIVVAEELLYPTHYGDIQLPSPGGSREGSVSTIAIAAGTPQDFEKRNIGVEMEVTPTVEDNDNISLLLEPKVTEFEGFVEYGGPSVAVGGDGTVVTVPSGFFQPIFSTRQVRTEVTIYDGATVVIGGLVREEIKHYKDKVPLLGDIPLVGKLFQSSGETTQKRNLMIFVTANLVSPGGSPSRQQLENVDPNTLYQNPQLLTPGGLEDRKREDK